MRVLALDFDGVICDSVRECFATAVRTYHDFVPDSRLVARIHARLGVWPWSATEIDTEPDFARFGELVPLGNRAEDFGVALLAMDLDLPIPDQESYDAFHGSTEPDWLDLFHRRFYEVRSALRADSLRGWLALHFDYPEFTAVLPRLGERAALAVATAKDAESLDLLLDRFQLSGLFAGELRLDKETGVQKTEHLTRLAERLGVPLAAITFVDDKVNHLRKVASLGVRPVLASWGHNTERERAAARALGFEVARLDDADHILVPQGAP
jgi:phosphoglycolate phosphatase-like HAD superfamily hydrolase